MKFSRSAQVNADRAAYRTRFSSLLKIIDASMTNHPGISLTWTWYMIPFPPRKV
ncbi:hypothetical protein PUN28_003428 [Cardiocondyla obscurior]|uniref:Uncharacterized protein n=1 Tax=Cardiocondyla obscurior TaxID=286306 RepID=A0AAW2GNL6_9HYME